MRCAHRFCESNRVFVVSSLLVLLFSIVSTGAAQTAEFTQANKGTNTVAVEVPLGSYPGRGINLPITLRYSSGGLWRVGFINSVYVTVDGYQIRRSAAEAIYAAHSTAGWKTSLDVPEVEWPKQNDRYWYTGKPYANGYVYPYTFRIAQVVIHMPDGSTHEMRKSDQVYQDNNYVDMTGTFYAVDGSRMRYDSTGETTGTLYLADGTRYIFNSSTTQYIDRNGNTLSYNASNRQWTDTLGRVFNMPWPANPSAGDYTYSIPGLNGAPITYTLKFRSLSSVFIADISGQTQKPISDYYLPYPGSPPTSQGSYNFPQPTGTSTLFTSGYSDPDEQDLQSYTYVVGRGQSGASTFDPPVLAEIDLPNGQNYRFYYNAYGELDKVIYPTGGYQRYQYGTVGTIGGAVVPYAQGTRGMVSRWLSPSGNGSDEAQWTYSTGTYPLTVTAPTGARSETYLYNAAVSQSNNFGYADARNGLPFEERIYAPASQGGAMLRRSLIDYEQSSRTYNRPSPGSGSYTAYRNARPIKTVSLILDTGGNALASTTTTSYDSTYQFSVGPDATSSSQYDYASVDQTTAQSGTIGSMPTGSLVRTTQTAYVYGSYLDRNILGLSTTTTVYNSSWTMVAQTTISYDESSLYNYGYVAGWTDPGTSARGNPTTVSHWLDLPSSTTIQTHAQYDQAGSVISSTDARGSTSQISYSPSYAYAYITQTTTAVPDPNGTYGSNTGLIATSVYDFYTGLVTSTTDANNKTTILEYNDSLNRPTKVIFPDGGYTRKIYVDAHQCGPYIESKTLLDSSGRETDSFQFLDGLGRAYRAFSYENQDASNPYITVDTQYDSMGRTYRVSSPYRSSGCTASINPTGRWTTTSFDWLSRPTSVVTSVDNATVTTSYSGNSVTVTDPANKSRRSVSDALGRLAAVYEDPNGVNYQTSYSYDALGNLRYVNQGGEYRYFMYDSLGRLIRAKYPEQDANGSLNLTDPVSGNSSWSAAYGYDSNGNITSRVDARGITTSYAYDALNRNYSEGYSDGTPTIYRYYDASTNGKGRLYWQQAVGVFANVVDNYDAMGRATQYRQRFWVNGNWGNSFQINRTYDYAGDVLTQTYPSGHTVSYAYDIAARISNYSGTLGDGVTRTYSSGISFSEFGGIQQEQFGTQTALYNKRHYNARGQLYDIRLSTQSLAANEFDWNRGCLAFYFGGAAWGQSSGSNNGNLTLQQHWVPTNDQISDYSYTQDGYNYDDPLNRLSYTTEIHGGPWGQSGQDYAQVYNYDRWGNRTVDQNNTWGNYIPKPNYTVDTNTNRLVAPSGYTYSYDAAGNQTYDNYTGEGTRTYDAESHLKTAWANNQWQTYTYDANGKRIKRLVNGSEVWQIYGLGGELIAEYKSGAALFLPSKEYGYRGGELLVTMSSGDDNRLSRFVTNLYRGALQRDPASTELTNGINSLASAGAQGYSPLLTAASDLARGLFQQTGYETSPYRSDIQFVADLYYTYLQRGPDDGGLNWWAQQVPGNGRSNVALGFEYSGEFQTLVSTLYGSASSDNQRTEHFVNNFYLAVYGRDATSYEIQVNRDALNNAAAQGLAQVQGQAETMARNLFAPQVTDYSISDQQFVTNLYEGFLQRGPDAGGLGFWTYICSINGRQSVLNGFAASTEFRELSATLYREEYWLINDRLGSPRMIVDKSGSLAGVRRHDYLPFGEELYAGIGGRSTTQGYMGDPTRQKFTGYEADAETGLNFAQARYQSPVQGRFTSVDPLSRSATIADPQSFNRYSYVENNPTNATDPTGMMMYDASMGWGDVSGMWEGGGGDSHFGAFENGSSIIAAREAERDALVRARIDGMLALHYLQNGDTEAANRIFESNSDVGRFVDGKALWGSDADVSEGSVTVQAKVSGWSADSTMFIIWEPGYNPFGHASYITMQDDTSWSWEGVINWTIDKPSSDYTNRRSTGTMGSAGDGYILDFGSLNAKFQSILLHAYDSVLGIKPPYGLVSNNCAKAGIMAINGIRNDLMARDKINLPKLTDLRPSAVKAYIETNLMRYVAGQQRFAYH